MEIFFYEKIACNLTGTDPSLLFSKQRGREMACLARQFCMVYRHEKLKLPQQMSANRYYRYNSAVIFAQKKFKNYKETHDEYYDLYVDFLDACEKELIEKNKGLAITLLHEQISTIGIKQYLNSASKVFDELSSKLVNEIDDEKIRRQLESAYNKIYELKLIYE